MSVIINILKNTSNKLNLHTDTRCVSGILNISIILLLFHTLNNYRIVTKPYVTSLIILIRMFKNKDTIFCLQYSWEIIQNILTFD